MPSFGLTADNPALLAGAVAGKDRNQLLREGLIKSTPGAWKAMASDKDANLRSLVSLILSPTPISGSNTEAFGKEGMAAMTPYTERALAGRLQQEAAKRHLGPRAWGLIEPITGYSEGNP